MAEASSKVRRKSYPGKAAAQRKRWEDPAYRERGIAAQKTLWRNPAHRAKMAATGFKPVSAEDHRADSARYSRLGVPNGYTKATAAEARATAEKQADMAVRGLERAGIITTDVLPNSDDALANAALRELFVIAISPGNSRTKLQALNTLLAFTKSKPAERRAISKANNPTDEWIQSVLQADSQPPAEHRRA